MSIARKKRAFQRKSDVGQFPLLDSQEPNLYRQVFPYEEVCRVEFDNQFIFIDPPEEIFITDTTFRDGQQARPPYTVEQIVDLFDMLHKLGGPNGVIRQCEFFLYSEKDKEALTKCMERNYRYPEITGWIRATKEDFKLVKEMGLKETGILSSVSDYHIFLKLKKNRRVVLREYLSIVSAALDLGIVPRCHFEDVTRADIYGFCVPLAQDLMRLSEESGIPVKIRLCDTMGYGVTYPGDDRRCRGSFRKTGVARTQRFLQRLDQRDHGVALRMFSGEWNVSGLRRTDRERAHRGVDHGLHQSDGTQQRH
jgi:hypothetical protein